MISSIPSIKSQGKSIGKNNLLRILNGNNNCYFFKYFNKPILNDEYDTMNPQRLKLIKRKRSTEMHSQLDTKLINDYNQFRHKYALPSLSKINKQESQLSLFKKASFEKNIMVKQMEKNQLLNCNYNNTKESEDNQKGTIIKQEKNRNYYPIISTPNHEISSSRIINDDNKQQSTCKKISLICIDNHFSKSSRQNKKRSAEVKVKKNLTEVKRTVKVLKENNDSFYDEVEELLNSVEGKCTRMERNKMESRNDENDEIKDTVIKEENKIDYKKINLINEARPQTSYGRISLRRRQRPAKCSSLSNE